MRRKKRRPRTLYTLLWFFIGLIWVLILTQIMPSFFKVTLCWLRESKELKKVLKEKEKIEMEKIEKQERLDNLKQGKGWEEELRKRGFVKQGEILIQIEGDLPKPPEKKEPLLQKILNWLEKREK